MAILYNHAIENKETAPMQLVYRTASYTIQPNAPALFSTPGAPRYPHATATLRTLLYRGQVYHDRHPITPPAPFSHTLNWRFNAVCNVQDASLKAVHA